MKKISKILLCILLVLIFAIPLAFAGCGQDVVVSFDKKYELIFDDLSDKTIVKDQSVGLPQVSEEYADLFLGWYDAERNQKIDDLNSITKSTVLEARFSKELSGFYNLQGKYEKTWKNLKEEYAGAFTENGIKSYKDYESFFMDFKGAFIIDESVNNIGEFAFCGCHELTEIIIPNSVTNIERHAFADCYGLTQITIPTSITAIDDHVFSSCIGLTSVAIPETVTSIGEYAFSSCHELTEITIPDSVTDLARGVLSGCEKLTSFTIPTKITSIERELFSGCRGLTSITIPPNITSIGVHAFSSCVGLTNIIIPDSVTTIGDYAFLTCSGLESVTFSSSVTSYGINSFKYDSNLTSITIDSAYVASSFGTGVFPYVKTVYVKNGLEVGWQLEREFTKQETSDKEGYDKYVKKS